ncbi:MAG: hypothetical protein NC097_08340, partial [Clostridium sp.]|nr:hypothetical protein [Clostridium sp.]
TPKEAKSIKNEIGQVINTYFNNDIKLFSEEYSLLSALYNYDEILNNGKYDSIDARTMKYYDALLVDYRPQDLTKLKHKIYSFIGKGTISLEGINGEETYFPLRIRNIGKEWVLVAINAKNNEPQLLLAEELVDAIFTNSAGDYCFSTDNDEIFDYIIGSGKIKSGLREITLILTKPKKDIDYIRNSRLFKIFKPEIFPLPSEYFAEEQVSATLKVFINDDFFEEVFYFDRNGHLIDIEPADVLDEYIQYFYKRTGKREWKSYDERPEASKIIKTRIKGVKE